MPVVNSWGQSMRHTVKLKDGTFKTSDGSLDVYVCIECGSRQHKLINQLQEGNYSLENCSQCGEKADKYIEYDQNLLALQVVLCKKQIYRHLFFNQEKIENIKRSCMWFTLIYLIMLYWNENHSRNQNVIPDYVNIQLVPGLSIKEWQMHKL